MILVNNPGSSEAVYAPLRHAAWHGCTLADLVFPFFLFIAGVSLEFSIERRLSSGSSKAALIRHVLWRSLVLIALGLVLNGAFYLPWERVRFPGVLQRIGVIYLFAALTTLTTSIRTRAAITVAVLLGYWALLTMVPVPGVGAGHHTQGGSLAAFVDRQLMAGHLWRPGWDPEGVLSTFPALATTLLGTFVADWLRANRCRPMNLSTGSGSSRRHTRIMSGLAGAGLCGVAIGWLWNWVFPVNKSLWTSSFVLLTAGWAALVLAACYALVDVRRWHRWARPLVAFGMNPLVIYAASEIVAMGALTDIRRNVHQHWVTVFSAASAGSLLWAIAYVALWAVIALVLYRNTIFIKL